MSAGHPRPPRPPLVARALLRRLLPERLGEEATADLDERFREWAVPAFGRRRARLWYWRQVLQGLWRRLVAGKGAATVERTTGAAMRSLGKDIRYGSRTLAASPGTTAVIVVTLAVGIGLNGAVFSLVNTILLKPLPLEEPSRLVFVDSANPERDRRELGVSEPDFRDWQRQAASLESLAAWSLRSMNLADGAAPPRRLAGARVTPSIFDVLRVEPVLGRRLGPADARPGAEPVVLLGHGVWQSRYGGDPGVLGRTVRVNRAPTTVIGVLPPELERTPFGPELWAPHIADPEQDRRDDRYLSVVGRLRDGATLSEARAQIEGLSRRQRAEWPATNEGVVAVVQTFDETFTETPNRVISWITFGAVLFLLLIACANVANLLLVRTGHRSREMALRTALGASRWRIVRHLLVESLLLSVAGGLLGAVLAVWGARSLEFALASANPPQWWDFSVDARVFAFLAAVSLGTALLFGLAPALGATRRDLAMFLKEGGRGASAGAGSRRFASGLVVAQLALAMVLLVSAGLMVRSTLSLHRVDPGIDPAGVLTMSLALPGAGYGTDEARVAFHRQLRDRLRGLPGVEEVAVASNAPLDGGYTTSVELADRPAVEGHSPVQATRVIVGPGYFELAGAQPLRGRLFGDDDAAGRVTLVSRRFAERHWPGEDPVGRRLRWAEQDDGTGAAAAGEESWITVVGVVPIIRQWIPMSFVPDYPVIFTPYRDDPLGRVVVLARTSRELASPGAVAGLADALRREVQAVDPELPLFDVIPLAQRMQMPLVGFRVISIIFGVFGGVALAVSCLGIYAVMAAAVGRRRQEIGVRMALGARSRGVVRLVVGSGLRLTLLGLGLGLVAAFGVTRVLVMFLHEIGPTDPLTFGAIVALLAVTAVAACAIPARRASRVDPLVALRDE